MSLCGNTLVPDFDNRRKGLFSVAAIDEDEIKALEAESSGEDVKPVSAKNAGSENLGGSFLSASVVSPVTPDPQFADSAAGVAPSRAKSICSG